MGRVQLVQLSCTSCTACKAMGLVRTTCAAPAEEAPREGHGGLEGRDLRVEARQRGVARRAARGGRVGAVQSRLRRGVRQQGWVASLPGVSGWLLGVLEHAARHQLNRVFYHTPYKGCCITPPKGCQIGYMHGPYWHGPMLAVIN
jgi:hypothetical protein